MGAEICFCTAARGLVELITRRALAAFCLLPSLFDLVDSFLGVLVPGVVVDLAVGVRLVECAHMGFLPDDLKKCRG